MFRTGKVTATDEANARARVQFADEDGMVSYWLSVLQHKTHSDKTYWMPDINEHVACLLDEAGEDGVILGARYSRADAPPVASKDKYHVAFSDGTTLEYDRSTHKLVVDAKGDVTIKSSTNIVIQAPQIGMKGGSPAVGTFEGSFALIGNLSVTGNISATGTIIDQGGNTPHHSH
jgi:phage baseplate assembly protein V